jgi:uncharacterized damage-inducible protein DinB
MGSAAQAGMSAEFAVQLRDMAIQRAEKESPTTQRVILAVPEDKKQYKPHPDSRTAWQLAVHLAVSQVWFLNSIADRKFDWTGEEKEPAPTIAGVAQWREQEIAKALKRVRAMTAEQLLTPVDFFGMMKAPVVFYLQFDQDHSVHHRGQLSTYLRPMGAKVPDIYGGSFDEPFTGQ